MTTLFVIPTSAEDDRPAASSTIENLYGYNNLKVFYNNKKPLLEVLLSVKKECASHGRPPNVVFMHDDLHIVDIDFREKIIAGFEIFDYFGVRGSNMMLVDNPRWHQTPVCNRKSNHGLMEHQTPNGQRYMTAFGPYPAACPIFDGVFMAFKWDVFKELKNVPEFDGFHLYDIELCTQAWDKGYKGGVMGIHLFHESRGEGILTDDWNKYAKVYSDRWRKKHIVIGG